MRRRARPVRLLSAALLAAFVTISGVLPARASAAAQTEDPAHTELRALRDDLVRAIEKRDLTRLLAHLHPDVVVTWQNAETSRGRAAVRAYLTRMLDGEQRIVERFSTKVDVDELTLLYSGGTTGVAFGRSFDRFELRNGTTFELPGRWTATLVKDDGAWKIAAFHASSNLFDNPFVRTARNWFVWGAAAASLIGFLLGALLVWLVKRRRTA